MLRSQALAKLVVHDAQDREVPIELAREMAKHLEEVRCAGNNRVIGVRK